MIPMKHKNKIIKGDCLKVLKKMPDESVDMVITSPPYWNLRDYNVKGQLGLEPTIEKFIDNLCNVFDEIKRVLKSDGTCWVNIGDTYSGNKNGKTDAKIYNYLKENSRKIKKKAVMAEKCLCQIPSRFAIEMTTRGWILRNEIIWHKPNAMPSSVKDRFTVDFEKLFFFSKSKKYYFKTQYDRVVAHSDAWYRNKLRQNKNYNLKKPYQHNFPIPKYPDKKNKRTVWAIPTKPFPAAHFAVYPPELCIIPIRAGCPDFVCKKCGKARHPIFIPTDEYKKYLGKSWTEDTDLNKKLRTQIGFKANTKKYAISADYEISGYTDCGCNAGWDNGIVLDPFFGAGTSGLVAQELGKNWIGIELSDEYIKIAKERLAQQRLNI